MNTVPIHRQAPGEIQGGLKMGSRTAGLGPGFVPGSGPGPWLGLAHSVQELVQGVDLAQALVQDSDLIQVQVQA